MPIVTPQERIGTVLGGKYRVGALLGKGGMGAVFRGEHELTGRAVALKLLHPEHTQSEEVGGRFLREARTAAGLKHPNVVDVLDMGREGEAVYMVLELLEGEALSTLLADAGALPVERAAEILLPVMRAVAMAHSRSVVHRDLKPENIFLHHDATGAEIPKILDFGIAKALGEEQNHHVTQTGFVLGTPAYMSPEQAEGIPERIGAPADVWSMGVVWYEVLSGSLPFGGQTHTAILLSVAQGKFQRLTRRAPNVPVALAQAIDKALVKDVTRRYPDMGAFLEAIQRALDAPHDVARESPVSHEPSLPPALTTPWTLGAADEPPVVKIELGPPDDPGALQTPIPLVRPSTRQSRPQSDSLVAPVTLATHAPPRPVARYALGLGIGLAFAAGIAAFAAGSFRDERARAPRPRAAAPAPVAPDAAAPMARPAPLPAPPDAGAAATPMEGAPVPALAPPSERGRRRRDRREEPEDGPTAEQIRANPMLVVAPRELTPPAPAPPAPAVNPPPPPPPPPAPRPTPDHAPMRDYESTP